MQRFNTSDLDRLETLFSTKGFTYQAKRTDERQGKPPVLSLELKGGGTLESIHDALRSAPFVLTDMSSRKQPDGLSVRLQLMQGKVLEDDGWTVPVEDSPVASGSGFIDGSAVAQEGRTPEECIEEAQRLVSLYRLGSLDDARFYSQAQSVVADANRFATSAELSEQQAQELLNAVGLLIRTITAATEKVLDGFGVQTVPEMGE